MPRVFIPQEPHKVDRETGMFKPVYDLSATARWGVPEVLLPTGPVMLSTAPMVRALRSKMDDFNDDDYVCAIGDPAAIGAAMMVAGFFNHGRVKVLRWDRRANDYIPISIDLHERKERNA